jgi:hypothetical protein
VSAACIAAETLGDAILRARDGALGGEGHTVAIRDEQFCVIKSAEYARLRETQQHGGITPLISFLPRGGIDVHRASFEPIKTALINHERW